MVRTTELWGPVSAGAGARPEMMAHLGIQAWQGHGGMAPPGRNYMKFALRHVIIIINPWRACAARVTVVVLCVSICLFVHDYSRTTGYEVAYERYQHLQCHKGTKKNWRFC